jgi:hypothetical protein
MKPDDIYAEYDEMLTWSSPIESRRFFGRVLAEDLPATGVPLVYLTPETYALARSNVRFA